MTATQFARAARLGSISAFALCLALGAPAALAQETLPTIEVGRKITRPSAATSAAPAPAKPRPAPVAQRQPQPRPRPQPQPTVLAAKPKVEPNATASSEREFTGKQVTDRIYAQPQEALEIVPGLVIAQHSGSGKAAQYFLRGFALDHGYDIGLTLDGMNINQASHVHSNGYADANFLIPELLSTMDIRKGPYYADEGVFSSVGAVHMQYVDSLREGLVSASGGSFAWGRLLGAKSWGVGSGELLMAIEGNIYNGPWERPDEERKINGLARWSTGTQENGFSITGMAYSNHYFATDQIPYTDVALGLMSRWGTQDPTDGGNAARYSVSARWSETNKQNWSRVEAFFIHNDTNLYDDFTYQLASPYPGPGDQTHQFDHRNQVGFNAEHGWKYSLASVPTETRVGTQNLFDFIHNGNGDSFQRQQYDQISDNYIKEYIQGAWTDTTLKWTPWLRTTGAFRLDYVHGSVNSVVNPLLANGWQNGQPLYFGSLNNGELGRFFTSPKGGLVLGPFAYNTEFFLNYGEGLRAEDMRGATNHYATPDGISVQYIPNVQLLTKTRGAEAGVRAKPIEGLETSLSLFWQNLDAEQEFNADSATSVYGRPGRRYGFEWTGNYTPYSWLRFDGEVTGTHARFKGFDTIQAVAFANYLAAGTADPLFPLAYFGSQPGNYLSLAPVWVATGGVEIGEKKGWFGGLQYRYFGARPLTEDGQIQSPATGTLNARVGYRFDNGWKLQLDGFNIANSRSDMIDYSANVFGKQDFALFPGYPYNTTSAGILERTFKPIDPPAVRLTVSGPLSWGEAAPVIAKY